MDFQRVIEEQLRKAREEGKFDHLRGHGQPLRLDENPFEDPTWQGTSGNGVHNCRTQCMNGPTLMTINRPAAS